MHSLMREGFYRWTTG